MSTYTNLMAYVARESDEEQAAFAALLAARDAETLREGADAVAADTGHIQYGTATDYANRHADLLRRMADARAEQPAAVALPRRGDAVEQWLKAQRDEHPRSSHAWFMVDCVLDRYRLHADTGTPLDQHVCESKTVGDCGCLETPEPGGA